MSISSYLILIISIPINIKVVKKFYLENRKLLLSIFILITIYIVSYFILPAKITYHSILLNFIFKDINLSNFIFKNFIVFFLIIFILNIFLINQLKFQEKEVFNILLKFSLFFFNFIYFTKYTFFFR